MNGKRQHLWLTLSWNAFRLYAAAETPSLGLWSATASTSPCSPSTFVLMARAGMCHHVPDWRLFLSFWGSHVPFSSTVTSPPVSSCCLFRSCHLLQSGKCVSAFCSVPKHSALRVLFFFFLILSFKRLDFLNEAFESYRHGPFKNQDVKPFGVIFLAGGPWHTEEFLTSTNKPFSLNSTLWINLFYLMVNVACATQKLVGRVCVTAAPGQDAIH